MSYGKQTARFSTAHPKAITATIITATLLLALVAALPSIRPDIFSKLHPLSVDTDPENMLSAREEVRLFHNRMKKEMALYDMVVIGVVNKKHPQGVFNPASLQKIYDLTEFAKTLRWPSADDPGNMQGVIESDIISPSTVDTIEQISPGTVSFEWLMPSPPESPELSAAVRDKAARLSLLNGTLVSEDGKALCIYLPLTSKDLSYRVYQKLNEKIAGFAGDEEFHITGLPVAEDTFGVEMFIQMAISAPLAMLIIFFTLLLFFRKLVLILSPLILAMLSTICTMGILIAAGNTIHIMSSMIPIFIMPIAVLDSVHILSEFFDRYQINRDRQETIIQVMDDLFMPMLYTSLTTAVGFASLALAPIPPVQVFGLFVALGVLLAWLFTITFIPAYVMFIPEQGLEGFGRTHKNQKGNGTVLGRLGAFTYRNTKTVMAITVLLSAISLYGIFTITINDNPIKWFTKSHPIRVADRILNEHFGGTYTAYLALAPIKEEKNSTHFAKELRGRFAREAQQRAPLGSGIADVFKTVGSKARELVGTKPPPTPEQLLTRLSSFALKQQDTAPEDRYEAWDEAILLLDKERGRFECFKQPELLTYIDALQKHMLTSNVVGKSNSLSDIVKTVYRELISGEDKDFVIPQSSRAVAQCLITYQNSHRPHDIWHFATPDYKKTVLWVQLKSGDNRDMVRVVDSVKTYMHNNPPPIALDAQWFGLTYINVIWQQKMVRGMLEAFLGSFLIVFLMMSMLYRSALWGLLSMVPLTVTIVFIYGIIGLIGKDYDMPVAVLSSLSLGLAVDYAIHFLSRTRALFAVTGSWSQTVAPLFGEPARAIGKNIIVLGVGFLPLLFAPLVPYKTVGIFIASILLCAGVATLFILPSLITLLEKLLFPEGEALKFTCKCGTCIVSAIALVALVIINLMQFTALGVTALSWVSIAAVLVLALGCYALSRRQSCSIG